MKLFESEIDFQLRIFFSHYLSKAFITWNICGSKAWSNSRLVRFWHSQNLTNLELEHELDLRLKKFYKNGPRLLCRLPCQEAILGVFWVSASFLTCPNFLTLYPRTTIKFSVTFLAGFSQHYPRGLPRGTANRMSCHSWRLTTTQSPKFSPQKFSRKEWKKMQDSK